MSTKKANRAAAAVNSKMEPSKRAKLEIEGKAHGNATMRIDTHPIFQRVSGIDGNRTAEIFEHLSIIRLFLQEKYGLDYDKERQHFSKVRAETFERYNQEELKKLMQKEETARMAIEVGKQLVMQYLVPFIDEQRVKWTEKITDDVTKQETPNIITMVSEVADIGNIDSILRPKKFMEWLINDLAGCELSYRRERDLTLEQKEHNVNATFKVVIICRPVLTP